MNQITTGMALRLNGDIYIVAGYQHVKPGKGGAFVKARLRNLKNDAVIDRTFKPAEKLQDVFLEERNMQYLYRTADSFHFMDQTTFEESIVSINQLGNDIRFLQDNLDVKAIIVNHQIQKIMLPNFIITEVTATEPGFKGDSSRAGTKPATIDTGTQIQVPLFINKGDRVKIDTRTGGYVERVKK